MTDDIVTLLRREAVEGFSCTDWTQLSWNVQNACDEIERLRTLLDNTLERENKDNARQLDIVRKVESDRNRWRATAEVLARELGKVEYAYAEWHNQEGLH